jgi:threonine dehydratase
LQANLDHRLTLERIAEAALSIDPVFLNTPQYDCEGLSDALNCELVLKVEVINPIRSFKGRGADYFFVRNPDVKEVVCASAGNFGQGIAYAARRRNIKPVVFASVNANPLKLARMRALGADVRLQGEDFDAAKLAGKDFAQQNGSIFVEDSRDVEFSEGAATMAVELLRESRPFDALLVPLGNGAMIAGIGRWLRAHAPKTRVIGISAAGAPAMELSWRSGSVVQTKTVATIADGIGVRIPVPEALDDIKGLVDDILLVTDDNILAAMRLIYDHTGLQVEPSAAVGVAAIQNNARHFAGQRLATILCGSNVTAEQATQWFGAGNNP